jgi:hypothetical protein
MEYMATDTIDKLLEYSKKRGEISRLFDRLLDRLRDVGGNTGNTYAYTYALGILKDDALNKLNEYASDIISRIDSIEQAGRV